MNDISLRVRACGTERNGIIIKRGSLAGESQICKTAHARWIQVDIRIHCSYYQRSNFFKRDDAPSVQRHEDIIYRWKISDDDAPYRLSYVLLMAVKAIWQPEILYTRLLSHWHVEVISDSLKWRLCSSYSKIWIRRYTRKCRNFGKLLKERRCNENHLTFFFNLMRVDILNC